MKRGRPQPALKEVASMVATIIFQRAGNRVGHGGRAGASKHREEQDTGLESLDAGPAPRRRRVGKNDVAMIASRRRRKSIIFPLPSHPLSFPSDHKHEPHRSRADANQNEDRRKQRGRCVMIYPTRPRFVQRTSWTDDARHRQSYPSSSPPTNVSSLSVSLVTVRLGACLVGFTHFALHELLMPVVAAQSRGQGTGRTKYGKYTHKESKWKRRGARGPWGISEQGAIRLRAG